jgi:ATP-dependent protease ClpP protease subunit
MPPARKLIEEEFDRFSSIIRSERQILRDYGTVVIAGELDSYLAHDFIEDLNILRLTITKSKARKRSHPSKAKPSIEVQISSEGGFVDAAIACMQSIERARADGIEVIGRVCGVAMSGAFHILQSCSWRIMGPGSVLMAHGITNVRFGDLKDNKAEGKLLSFWQEYFADYLAKRVTTTIDEYRTKEFWLPILEDSTPQFYSPVQCLTMGLIDEVA